MAIGAATLTNESRGRADGFKLYSFSTTLNANAEDGVTVQLAWSQVDHVSITHKSATPVASGMSYNYASGVLTLYGAASGHLLDSATVTVMVFGKD